MTTRTTPPDPVETLSPIVYGPDDLAKLISTAVDHAVAATDPVQLGDHGLTYLVPAGFKLEQRDIRDLSDPILPHHRSGKFSFVSVDSIAQYVQRYQSEDTLGYITDCTGRGPASLTGDLQVARFVLDDHPVDGTAFREHTATLILRPTPAGRRWGAALAAGAVDQERLLDLVVDGIGEIAEPDGATLRDLIADLHAIRTTSARSVIRTGGQATVEVAENVTLHGGTGNTVTIPERITVMFLPFTGVPAEIAFDITVKPKVGRDERVSFVLDAPALDERITEVLDDVAGLLKDGTGIVPMWVP
jgi:hypothetical protein